MERKKNKEENEKIRKILKYLLRLTAHWTNVKSRWIHNEFTQSVYNLFIALFIYGSLKSFLLDYKLISPIDFTINRTLSLRRSCGSNICDYMIQLGL